MQNKWVKDLGSEFVKEELFFKHRLDKHLKNVNVNEEYRKLRCSVLTFYNKKGRNDNSNSSNVKGISATSHLNGIEANNTIHAQMYKTSQENTGSSNSTNTFFPNFQKKHEFSQNNAPHFPNSQNINTW